MVTPVWLLTVPTCITTAALRSEEHTSELRHLVISYAVFCLKKHQSEPGRADPRQRRRRTLRAREDPGFAAAIHPAEAPSQKEPQARAAPGNFPPAGAGD